MDKKERKIKLSDTKLLNLCIKICDTMPVKTWKSKEPCPWECKITKESGDYGYEWYCDECPVTEICPHDGKEWSK